MSASSFGSLSGALSLSTSAFTKGVQTAKTGLTSLVSSFASTAMSIAKYGAMFGVAFAGVAIAGGTYLVGLGAELNELNSKFALYFGESTNTAEQFAKNLAGSIGRSVVETKTAMASFQSLMVPLGLTEEASVKLSQSLTKLGYDLGSVNNMNPTDVMERLRSAMISGGESVASLGIILNDATRKNEMFSLGLRGEYSALSEAQKALVNYSIIVKGSNRAIGDAFNTSGGFANQLLALKATVYDSMASFGLSLSNYLTPFLQGVNYGIELLRAIAISFGGVGSVAGPSFEQVKAVIDTVVFSLLNWDLTLKKLGLVIVEFCANSVNQIKAFFQNMGIGLAWAWNNWKAIFETIGSFTYSVFTNLWTNIKNGFQELWRWISSGFMGEMKIDWQPLLQDFSSSIKEFPNFVTAEKANYQSAWDHIRDEEKTRWDKFQEMVAKNSVDKSAMNAAVNSKDNFIAAGDVKGLLDQQKANPKKATGGKGDMGGTIAGSAEAQAKLFDQGKVSAKERMEQEQLKAQQECAMALQKMLIGGMKLQLATYKV